MVEIDVRLSRDGTPVVMHDLTLARTVGRPEKVHDLTSDVLSALRLEGTEERLPTLATALQAGGDRLLFDIDVKDEAQLPAVAAFLSTHPDRSRFMLKADVASAEGLDRLLSLQSSSGLTVIAKTVLSSLEDLGLLHKMREADIAAIELWFPDLNLLRAAVSVGVPITTYTLPDVHCAGLSDARALQDPASVWGALDKAGIRAIMTDAPEAAQAFLERNASLLN